MLYFSTSLRPTKDGRSLARIMADIFGGMYENRGNKSFENLISRATYFGYKIMAIVNETRGKPNAIVFYKIKDGIPRWEHMGKFVVDEVKEVNLEKKVPSEIKGRCKLAKELKLILPTVPEKRRGDSTVSLNSKGISVNNELVIKGKWTFY